LQIDNRPQLDVAGLKPGATSGHPAVVLLGFLNLAGMEKAILAILLGLRALRPAPLPTLEQRRGWARMAIGLGVAHIVLVVTIVLLNLDRLSTLIDALRAMSDLR
jgi:hypothetical protein